jgi:hypothetical protein
LRGGQASREFNFEKNEKVTSLIALLVEGETLVNDSHNFVGLDHETGLVLNSELGAIEVSHDKVDTGESFKEGNFLLNEQVSTLTLEDLVRHLFDNNDDIAGLGTGELISLSVEDVVVAIRGTLIDLSLDDLLLLDDLLSIANFALEFFVDNFSLTSAIVTGALRLRVHAGAELDHLGDHTTSLATRTLLDSAFFTAETIASSADSLSVDSNLGLFAIINFFESDLEGVLDGLSFLGTTFLLGSATTSSEHREDIVHATASTAAFSLDSF